MGQQPAGGTSRGGPATGPFTPEKVKALDVLVYVIPIALFLGTTGLCAFRWALTSGQYDDIDGAEYRVLTDD